MVDSGSRHLGDRLAIPASRRHNYGLKLSGGPRRYGRSLATLRVAPSAAFSVPHADSARPARSLTLIR